VPPAIHKVHQYCLLMVCLPEVADNLLWDQEVHRCTTTALEVTQVTTLVVCSIRCDEVVLLLHPHLFLLFYFTRTNIYGRRQYPVDQGRNVDHTDLNTTHPCTEIPQIHACRSFCFSLIAIFGNSPVASLRHTLVKGSTANYLC
jgi:hypothetical protein